MFPLWDTVPSLRKPYVNYIIIWINIIVFIYELTIDPRQLMNFFYNFGFVPVKFFSTFNPVPLITHMFIHGGWLHIIGNLWFLKIFGDNVEDTMGHFRFLRFYIFGGLAALFTHTFFSFFSDPTVPMVGASGAISAVMGAYFILFTYSRIVSVVFFILPFLVEIPATIYLFYWFILQIFNGLLDPIVGGSGVAYWAHAGGFVYGLIEGYRIRQKRYWY